MRALFDVNMIIALLDPDHVFHERAHGWWGKNLKPGWASCPLTENGVVRIMSNPNYRGGSEFTAGDLIYRLRDFAEQTDHEFWADDLSLRDDTIFNADRIHSSRQLTDIYLLALAVRRSGRLVTFDESISLSTVKRATATHLCTP